ncbi:MAG: hypothetical protein Q4B26_19580 [Eubacteriales bacterium]|nr:hypothetical protein [Eubacteriales bacterium]
MGQFSWLYSDTGKAMKDDLVRNSYLLVPPPFQKEYGEWILETCYDGYGHFGSKPYDVYELVVIWNREHLTEEMLIKPERASYQDEEWYQKALERYQRKIRRLISFKETGECTDGRLREIGIDIACYDEQNEYLPYPIKITSKPMRYEEAKASKSDPDQGW